MHKHKHSQKHVHTCSHKRACTYTNVCIRTCIHTMIHRVPSDSISMNPCTHAHTHAHAHTCKCIHRHPHTYTHTHSHKGTRTDTSTQICTRAHTYTRTQTGVVCPAPHAAALASPMYTLPLVFTMMLFPGDSPLTSSSPSTCSEPCRPSLQGHGVGGGKGSPGHQSPETLGKGGKRWCPPLTLCQAAEVWHQALLAPSSWHIPAARALCQSLTAQLSLCATRHH